MTRLLERNHHLHTLHVVHAPHKPDDTELLLLTISRSLPQLRWLQLFKKDDSYPIINPRVAREFFDTCSSHLEYLSVALSLDYYQEDTFEDDADSYLDFLDRTVAHPNLHCFCFVTDHTDYWDGDVLPWALVRFLGGCSSRLEVVDNRPWLAGSSKNSWLSVTHPFIRLWSA